MSVRDPRRLSDLCRDVEACVDRSGVVALIEGLLPTGGRPRELTVRTFLVGMMLAVRAGLPPHIEKARWVLNELPHNMKLRLGVIRDTDEEITYKQMADMFERIAEVIDPSPHFRGANISDQERTFREDLLVEITDKLLEASIPADVPHEGSYSIDGTNVDSWARPKVQIINNENGSRAASHLEKSDPKYKQWAKEQKKRKAARNRAWPTPASVRPQGAGAVRRKTRVSTTHKPKPDARRKKYGVADPDSCRYERDGWKRDGKYGFGLEMHSFVMICEEGDPFIPPFARHLRLTPNRPEKRPIVIDMAKRMAMMGEPISDAVYDSGYGEFLEINAGLRRAGFAPVFDLVPGHRGVLGAVAGAVVVDGVLYSPGLPDKLRNLKPPAVGTGMAGLNRYQELIAERQRYALRQLGSRPNPDGTIRYQCPAAAGRIACPVKPQSLAISTSKGMVVPTQVPAPGAQGDVCKQASVTIDLDDPASFDRTRGYVGGLYQKHPFGSDAHYDSMKRRSYVESSYGNIKNEAEQNLRRPSIRVMGRAKMTLISVVVVAAANLRMGRLWTRRQHRIRTGGGPSTSPVMKAATRARQRAEARRRRAAEGRERAKLASSPSARARGRPPD